ncbi:MAG TPA: c-type cytochrome [Gemmatimonadaceae bacterium]
MTTQAARTSGRRWPASLASAAIALALVLLPSTRQAQAPAVAPPVTPAGARDTVSKATLLLGEKIFKGVAAHGLCFTCHGANAKGIPGLGPDLTDTVWLHGDGSVAFIRALVKAGVPKAKKSPATMPPYGGSPLVDPQLEAVAQYVHSLSNK